MPGRFEIMRAVKKGLDSLETATAAHKSEWTKDVGTKLCGIGRKFGFKVFAKSNAVHDDSEKDGRELLYDVTWLEYEKHCSGELTDAPLVAECEWEGEQQIGYDFNKLLLARAGVRVMIFGGGKEIVDRLAVKVKEFNGSRAEDAWLLAAWEQNGDAWRFRYFTIGGSGEAHVQEFS